MHRELVCEGGAVGNRAHPHDEQLKHRRPEQAVGRGAYVGTRDEAQVSVLVRAAVTVIERCELLDVRRDRGELDGLVRAHPDALFHGEPRGWRPNDRLAHVDKEGRARLWVAHAHEVGDQRLGGGGHRRGARLELRDRRLGGRRCIACVLWLP